MRAAAVILIWLFAAHSRAGAGVSFNRDVRPILAEKCLECHGPAKAKGGLRLDLESSATNVLKSGFRAVAPGDSSKSEAMRRLHADAREDRMPPEESGKSPLGEKEIAVLEKWISEGAKWDGHWAFQPIRRPTVPSPKFPELTRNAIDVFVQRELAGRGLRPAEPASQRILERRLAFDLAGLPPFVKAESWEQSVDAYLAAPSFGERMGLWWLDLVRYADSEGYFNDAHRNVYPYRDYVIRAFNENKRFDQFTAEQLAGDLLPNAGWEEKIASGYNRLILTTHEAGAVEGDYRARYAADRVRNLGTVWLGLTVGCAQCHDHKYDPIPSADFYRMAAFFADIKEEVTATQPEVFVRLDAPEYRELVERSEVLARLDGTWEEDVKCEQVQLEKAILAGAPPPAYWPKGKRSKEIVDFIFKKAAGKATEPEERAIDVFFQRHRFVQHQREERELAKAREKFEKGAEASLITHSGLARPTRAFVRGNWMDESGPQVLPGLPKFLSAPATEEVMSRRELAEWLTSPENPLTARILANRLWQLFFGAGLVRTMDDFGAQGEAPSNPELLDFLASELLESGWNVKHLVRMIATSYTYQQSSGTSAEAREKDPENRLFGRQNRFQLPGELLRDNVRSIAGLLSSTMHGPPVKPQMPADFLKVVDVFVEEAYTEDTGDQANRRGVYLYRKRSFLHPTLAAFNASTREECASQRVKSNNPKEALALLNAPAFVDAARAFGVRMHDAACEDRDRLRFAFQTALAREPSSREEEILLKLLEAQRKSFEANPTGAAKSIRTGRYPWPAHIEAPELAAWTDVARTILNLEETNMRY